MSAYGEPILYKKIEIPKKLLIKHNDCIFGGDIRIGDLTGDGNIDFLVYRSTEGYQQGGLKPCFLAAFNLDGDIIWQDGEDGYQPERPGPVAIYDIDGDGKTEIINFYIDKTKPESSYDKMDNVLIQIRDGATGDIKKESQPEELLTSRMVENEHTANWIHHRLFISNFRGTSSPRDFVVKLGTKVIAFDEELDILWTYKMPWKKYGNCAAYIPAVGDIDRDGKDEVNGGYYLLDDDGTVKWEKELGPNMDSVAITEWDNGQKRAICSGGGYVLDEKGNKILYLGKTIVPHGQELRVANFLEDTAGPEMIIRYNGHNPDCMLVSNSGEIIKKFNLNYTPNNTGMEYIYWHGQDKPALLYNGGKLWNGDATLFSSLPEVPEPVGDEKMGWYHCIPANVTGDDREELILYNPWDKFIYIYTPYPVNNVFKGYQPTARQYNARLMD